MIITCKDLNIGDIVLEIATEKNQLWTSFNILYIKSVLNDEIHYNRYYGVVNKLTKLPIGKIVDKDQIKYNNFSEVYGLKLKLIKKK